MKRSLTCFLLVLLLTLPALTLAQAPAADRDTLFQVATLDGLMAGLYDGVLGLNELLRHGDTGLGTFDGLDGEMIVLNGSIYQVRSDGRAQRVTEGSTPFAAVSFLDRDVQVQITRPTTFKELCALIDTLRPSANIYYLIRVDGEFARVKTRSVPRQSKPYPPLTEVAARQPVFEIGPTQGTLVGLWCPYYALGTNLPGYHLHYLTADRTQGGHVLELNLLRGTLTLDLTPAFHLRLPMTPDFLQAPLAADHKALEKVEK
jgi:acetolactate decarboxylase